MSAEAPLGRPEPWPAPGKLNLFLHVIGRRADGYHLLQTAFQFIDRCDELRFYRRPAGTLELKGATPGVPDAQNLVLRAAEALRGARSGLPGVAIALEKRLPMQGGVGGGSSDAATVLVALDRLWGLNLGADRLAELALTLGADVPVFVHGRACWAEGIGERLTPVDFAEPVYVLLCPDDQIATAEIFQSPDLTRDSPAVKITDFLHGGQRDFAHSCARGGLHELLRNDCEPVVRRRSPAVARALDWLAQFGQARLTGTGSCVFVAMADAVAAGEVARRAPAPCRAFVVQGLNRSPLAARLQREPI